MSNLKHFMRLGKKQTETNLLSTEYVVLNDSGELKGTFQTLKEANKMLYENPKYNGYIFKTYSITTKQKL